MTATLPAAPLPSLRNILRSLAGPMVKGEGPWLYDKPELRLWLYQRGSMAMAAAVESCRRSRGGAQASVWLPGYFCDEALAPLRRIGARLEFYPVRDDLAPDWPRLNQNADGITGINVFVLVHYFGFPNDVEGAKDFCRRRRMELLEDCAHMAGPLPGVGISGMSVYSPRKLFPAPAGGVLSAPESLTPFMDSAPQELIEWESLRWLAKSLTQKILRSLGLPWRRSRALGAGVQGLNGLGKDFRIRGCDYLTRKLLGGIEGAMADAIRRRRENYLSLASRSAALRDASPLISSLGDLVCPYVFPLVAEHDCGLAAAELRAAGVPAVQWPDLPPEVQGAPSRFPVEARLCRRLMLLPVHQSLDRLDMERIFHSLEKAFRGPL